MELAGPFKIFQSHVIIAYYARGNRTVGLLLQCVALVNHLCKVNSVKSRVHLLFLVNAYY